MEETRQVNRCFGGHCSQNPTQQSQKRVKEMLFTAAEKRRAKKELDYLLLSFHGRKSILQLLPAIKHRCSRAALALAIERVEVRKDGLKMEDQVYFEGFKASLKE